MGTLALFAAAAMVLGTAGNAANPAPSDAANPAPRERSSGASVALSLGATLLGYGVLAADVAVSPRNSAGPLLTPVGLVIRDRVMPGALLAVRF